MLNVGEQLIPHGFYQCFRCLGVVHPEGVIACDLDNCHRKNGKSHDPQVLTEIPEAADGTDGIHDESREVPLFAAQSAVHRCTYDLGLEHIGQCRYTGCQNRHQEVPLGAS